MNIYLKKKLVKCQLLYGGEAKQGLVLELGHVWPPLHLLQRSCH